MTISVTNSKLDANIDRLGVGVGNRAERNKTVSHPPPKEIDSGSHSAT